MNFVPNKFPTQKISFLTLAATSSASAAARIDQHPLSLHYSLKLPQAIYNPATKTVEDIFSPPGTRDREVITQGMLRLFETPGKRLALDRLADRYGNIEGDDDEEEKDDQQGDTRVR